MVGQIPIRISGMEASSSSEEIADDVDLYDDMGALAFVVSCNGEQRAESSNLQLDRSGKMDASLWGELDEGLLEKVFAKLPFKPLFRISTLSKMWASNFLELSFQDEVYSATAAWESFCPLFVGWNEVIGYESRSQLWHKLPPWRGLPIMSVHRTAAAGSLLCWANLEGVNLNADEESAGILRRKGRGKFEIIVCNPLRRGVRAKKKLPQRPDMRCPHVIHIVPGGTKSYQVIMITEISRMAFPLSRVCVQIYDSSSDSWTIRRYCAQLFSNLCDSTTAYCNGVVYMLGENGQGLTIFDVHKESWIAELNPFRDANGAVLGNPYPFYHVRVSEVVVCNSNMVMLVLAYRLRLILSIYSNEDDEDDEDYPGLPGEMVSIFRLDPDFRSAREVSRAPIDMLDLIKISTVTGHGDFIYMGGILPHQSAMVYDVLNEEWRWMPSAVDKIRSSCVYTPADEWEYSGVAFQAGMNAFLDG